MKPNTNLEVLDRPGRDREALLGTLAEPGGFPAIDGPFESVGLDAGATLLKLCVEVAGERHFGIWPTTDGRRVLDWLVARRPTHLGVTGCGADAVVAALSERASGTHAASGGPATAIEFQAWALGANDALARLDVPATAPYLLVSLGTGTSALHVTGDDFERVGGTALGGGAALGIGHALLGVRSADELNALALAGQRESVDLLVSDLFDDAEGVGAMIASAFGKLARRAAQPDDAAGDAPSPEDLAAATLGIVADNVALLTVAHARACGVERIVYGGSTFYTHPQMEFTLRGYATLSGFDAMVLPLAGHIGALGAMLIGRRA